MSSRIACPFLFVNLGCEYIFLLESKLRSMTSLPGKKADEVLVDCTFALFQDNVIEKMFSQQTLYSPDEIRKIFFLVGQSPSLRIDAESLDKMFTIIRMIVKMQLIRLRKPEDMFELAERHFVELQRILERTGLEDEVRENVEKIRNRFTEWYADVSLGEFQRMRMTLLTFLHSVRAPVNVLVDRELQYRNGFIIPPTSGEPAEKVGTARIYAADAETVLSTYSLSIAGLGVVENKISVGENMFAKTRSDSTPASQKPLGPAARMAETVKNSPRPPYRDPSQLADSAGKDASGQELKSGAVGGEAKLDDVEALLQSFKT